MFIHILLHAFLISSTIAADFTLRVFEKKLINLGDYESGACGFDRLRFHDQLCFKANHCIKNTFPYWGNTDLPFEKTDQRFFVADTEKGTLSFKFREELIEIGKLVELKKDEEFVRSCNGWSQVGNPKRLMNKFTLYQVKLNEETLLLSVSQFNDKRWANGTNDVGSPFDKKKLFAVLKAKLKTKRGQIEIEGLKFIWESELKDGEIRDYFIESHKLNKQKDFKGMGYMDFYY